VQARVTILTSEQYVGRILRILLHGNILERGGAVLEGNSQEMMDNPDARSACFGLQGFTQTFRFLVGETFIDLHFLDYDSPKKEDKGKKAHS
jgi:hypothetical protein